MYAEVCACSTIMPVHKMVAVQYKLILFWTSYDDAAVNAACLLLLQLLPNLADRWPLAFYLFAVVLSLSLSLSLSLCCCCDWPTKKNAIHGCVRAIFTDAVATGSYFGNNLDNVRIPKCAPLPYSFALIKYNSILVFNIYSYYYISCCVTCVIIINIITFSCVRVLFLSVTAVYACRRVFCFVFSRILLVSASDER